jgi:hypothetical protein
MGWLLTPWHEQFRTAFPDSSMKIHMASTRFANVRLTLFRLQGGIAMLPMHKDHFIDGHDGTLPCQCHDMTTLSLELAVEMFQVNNDDTLEESMYMCYKKTPCLT